AGTSTTCCRWRVVAPRLRRAALLRFRWFTAHSSTPPHRAILGPTILPYHIMRSVVQHSKLALVESEMGQNPNSVALMSASASCGHKPVHHDSSISSASNLCQLQPRGDITRGRDASYLPRTDHPYVQFYRIWLPTLGARRKSQLHLHPFGIESEAVALLGHVANTRPWEVIGEQRDL